MIKTFDPFLDRTSRNIRNSLAEALVEELSGKSKNALIQIIQHWQSQDLEPAYRRYIEDHHVQYQNVLNTIKSKRIQNTQFQAIVLWNKGLFFELHELLETIWMPALGPERTGLKGLIQAAGVFVHLQRGKSSAAFSLAKKARENLAAGAQCLGFIINIDELIKALESPSLPAPVLNSI